MNDDTEEAFALLRDVVADHGEQDWSITPARAAALLAEIERLRAGLNDAFREAKALAEALFKKHYSHEPHYASGGVNWELCDSAAGIITQIDNMVAGLERPTSPIPSRNGN